MTAAKTPNVIVIDDDAEMVYLVQYLLEQCGYQSESATTLEAFKSAYRVLPSAVMLDLNMPNRASEDISQFLANQKAEHPIIFITGLAPNEVVSRRREAQALGLNIAAVLHKPFWLEDISSALSQALSGPTHSSDIALLEAS
jgi:FixJ family two-component response regulator